jgi:hypothetical protein
MGGLTFIGISPPVNIMIGAILSVSSSISAKHPVRIKTTNLADKLYLLAYQRFPGTTAAFLHKKTPASKPGFKTNSMTLGATASLFRRDSR